MCSSDLADIAIANYTFTDKNINFIISIIRSIQFIEDVYLGLETSNDMFEKFSDAHRGKVPDIYIMVISLMYRLKI